MPSLEELAAELAALARRVTALEADQTNPVPTTEDFEAFWKAYPRKVGKPDALRTWLRMSKPDRTAALAAAPQFFAIWTHAARERLRFCPHPGTWLRNRRWEDGIQEWRTQAGLPALMPSPQTIHPETKTRLKAVDAGAAPAWVIFERARLQDGTLDSEEDPLSPVYFAWLRGEVPFDHVPKEWDQRFNEQETQNV